MDGKDFLAQVLLNKMVLNDKEVIQARVYDITERKKSEDALKESEEKYRLLAYNSMDVIWKMDLKMVFTYASPSIKDSFGYTVDEWVGNRLSQYCSGKEFFKMARKAVYAVKGYKKFKSLTFEAIMLRKNGSEIPVEITAKLIFNKNGFPHGFQGTTRDITERKQLEKAKETAFQQLAASEQQQKAINQQLRASEQQLRASEQQQKAINQQLKAIEEELRFDIAERKKAEDALRKSEEKYHLLADNTLDCIWKLDKGMKFIYANSAVFSMMGYTPEEWVGSSLFDHCDKEEMKKVINLISEKIKKGIYETILEMLLIHKNGKVVPVEIHAKLLIDENKQLMGMQGTTRDITERKKAEDSLRASELRYRTLFETAVEGILIADVKTKKFKYANPAICKILGYSANELSDKSVLDIHPKKDLKKILADFNIQARGKKPVVENIPCLRKDGTKIYANIAVASEVMDGKHCSIGFFTDVTERKKMLEDLLVSREKFYKVFQMSPSAILITHLKTGEIINMNSSFERTFGYDREEIIGKTTLDIGFWKSLADRKWNKSLLLKRGYLYSTELEFITKLGKTVIGNTNLVSMEIEGEDYVIKTISDITERKRTEKKVKLSEEKYRELFEESISAIYVFDTQKNFIDSNKAGLDLLGYSRKELLKLTIGDVDAEPEVVLPANKKLFVGGHLINYEHKLKRKDGRVITVLNNSRPLIDADGKVLGMQSTLFDITEREKGKKRK